MKRSKLFLFIFLPIFFGCENYDPIQPVITFQGIGDGHSISIQPSEKFTLDSVCFASGEKTYVLGGELIVDDSLRQFNVYSAKPFSDRVLSSTFILPKELGSSFSKATNCLVKKQRDKWCSVEWRDGSKRIYLRNRITSRD